MSRLSTPPWCASRRASGWDPISAQRLAEQLRTTGWAGFRVGSALTDLVETLREEVVSERLPPRWRVGVLQHGTAQEAGREWEDFFGYGGTDTDE